MGIPKGYKFNKVHRWSEEEKRYLKEICFGKSHKEIATLMSNRFKKDFKPSQIMSAIHRYGLSTGRTGQFEKGLPRGTRDLEVIWEQIGHHLRRAMCHKIAFLLVRKEQIIEMDV